VCIVRVDSDVSDREVRLKTYEDDYLKVSLGIAQTQGFPLKTNIYDAFIEHIHIAKDFFINEFLPKVAKPIDDMIQSYNRIESSENG